MTFANAALRGVTAHAAAEVAEAPSFDQAMNEASFQVFYQRTAPGLRSYIRSASGGADVADDILQEAFLRFLRAVPSDLEKSQQKAYLYRIASRLLVDHWRRLSREQRWNWREYLGKGPAMHRDLALSPDLSRTFQILKQQQRALLWLAYVEGFEHREIASLLGLREKSVRVLLFRARRKLADLLKEKGLGPEVRR